MKKLIIAPHNLHHDLLKLYRLKDPFFDVKIMSKESLISDYKGKVSKEAIPYLMKKYDYSYDNVRVIIPLLPHVDENIKDLYEIKKDLIENHLISSNEYLDTFFLDKEIIIYGYSKNDKELLSLLNHFHLKYQFEENREILNGGFIYKYETAVDEVFFTLNKIASLIKEGVDINNIYIFNKNNDYKYYLEKFSKDFGFGVDLDTSYSLYETSLGSDFLNQFIKTKDINLSIELISNCHDQDLLNAFLEVIKESINEELSFEQQLDYFIGELKSHRYGNKYLNNVVRIIDSPIYKEDAYIFVLGFVQGSFPESHKDNGLLSDKDKERLNLNTSLDLTLMNEEILMNFFSSHNHFYFSYSLRSISQKYFISPWAVAFNLEEIKNEMPDVIYSRDMADFYFAKALDLKNYYSDYTVEYYALKSLCDIPYGIYDNTFKGVNAFTNSENIYYSYSKINTFYKCPFQFYISNVLGVDPFEGNFYTKFGTVAHAIFEHQNDDDFDFDKVFDENVASQDFLPEELPLVNNLKAQVKEASKASILHQHYMKNPRFITEKDVCFSFAPNSYLVGKIDKTIILDNKYLAIVDYKTGNDAFNANEINEGLSLQLPTYCLLASNDKYLNKYQVMGVFINNVIDTSLSHEIKADSLINPYYRLNGKVVADMDVISYLDNTISGNKSEFIKGVSITKEGTFKKGSANLSSFEELKVYASIALDKYKEANQRIRSNDFSINPLYKKKNDNACINCEYKDICFVKPSQRRYLNNEEIDESEDEDDE